MNVHVELFLTVTENGNDIESYVRIENPTLGSFDQILINDEYKEQLMACAEYATGWSRNDGLTIFLGTQLSDEVLSDLFQWADDNKVMILIEDGGTLPDYRVHVFAVKDYSEAIRFKLRWIGTNVDNYV